MRVKLPASVINGLKRGLDLHKKGKGGKGLVSETIKLAREGVSRGSWPDWKVVKASAWFARHVADRRRMTNPRAWNKAPNYSPAYVAWALWGDDGSGAGRRWIDKKAKEFRAKGVKASPRKNPGISDVDVDRLGKAYLEGTDISSTRRFKEMARVSAERVHREFDNVRKQVDVVFTERDPYPDFEALAADVKNNGRMYIYTGDSITPLWDERTNWMARAVHDYDHVTEGAGFGLQGEFMVYRAAAKRAPQLDDLYMSEVPLQAAAFHVLGGFVEGSQKVVPVNAALKRLVNQLGSRQNPSKRRSRVRMAGISEDGQVLGRFMPPREVANHLGAKYGNRAPIEEGVLGAVSSMGRKTPSKTRRRTNPPPVSAHVDAMLREFIYTNRVDKHRTVERHSGPQSNVSQSRAYGRFHMADDGHCDVMVDLEYRQGTSGWGLRDVDAVYINTMKTTDIKECQRKGYASEVLGLLTALADKHQVPLVLEASPFDHKAVSKANLVKFYQKYGFKKKRGSIWMIRKPEPAPRRIARTNPYMNCKLFVQTVTGIPKLDDLPSSPFRSIRNLIAGDVLKWGIGTHWAIYIGDGDIMEVEEWGAEPRTVPLSEILKEMDPPATVFSTAVKAPPRKNPPPPTQKDLVEAISQADVYREGWTLSDFRVEYRGVFHGEDLDQYDDLSAWLDLDSLDDEEDLIGFRGEAWAKRAKKWGKNIPPIVVITAPDEGRLHTQIGDGRGRVNYSVYSGIPLHVYEMTYVSPRTNPPQTSRHPMLLRHIVRGMFVQGSDNNATKTKAQIKQLVAMYSKYKLDPREELNLAFGTATNSLVDSGKVRKSKDGRRWVLTDAGRRASDKKRREQSSAVMKRKDQQYEWILEFTRKGRQ